MPESSIEKVTLHDHEVTYRTAGKRGPVVVLIHGIAGTSATWDPVLPILGERHRVIAPDLLGHGRTATPSGDFSLGAHATGVRDLLIALGHERATFVGHSLGGGVALQLGHQFPERMERLALVSSGGLGRELNLLLRSAALPGADLVLPLFFSSGVKSTGTAVARILNRVGLGAGADLEEIGRSFASLDDTEARQAFIQTVRSVIDPGGQRVTATNRLYLTEELPTLIVWGDRDKLIPVEHAHAAHREMPGSRLEIFHGAGHFPHLVDPERFAGVVSAFIAETRPARFREGQFRQAMLKGAKARASAPRGKARSRATAVRRART
jgi:pimeloyl-ACP methyl ester carboxylesterase